MPIERKKDSFFRIGFVALGDVNAKDAEEANHPLRLLADVVRGHLVKVVRRLVKGRCGVILALDLRKNRIISDHQSLHAVLQEVFVDLHLENIINRLCYLHLENWRIRNRPCFIC